MARDGRRRRVLNDEVRSASGLNLATFSGGDADAPRYGEQASVENHPQITDYVPRRKRAVIVTLLAGVLTAAGAEALVRFAEPIAAAIPGATAADIGERVAGGVVGWASAVTLLVCAMLAKLIYSLRRHRVNDYAGRYRVWRWIVWGALLASLNSVVEGHRLISVIAAAATGMSLSATGAEWWLAPISLVGGWISVRLMLEVSESRSSLIVMMLAASCYAAAAAGAMGWLPASLGPWAGMATFALPLVGHTLALAGLMIFGRYVVLDVQGLIEHKPRAAKIKAAKSAAALAAVKLAAKSESSQAAPSRSHITAAANQTREEGEDEEGDAADRRLSKAERKRLRREQRAA